MTLYRKHGHVMLPLTDDQIVDHCIDNPEIAFAIQSYMEDSDYHKWLKEVCEDVAKSLGKTYKEACELVEETGEAQVLYENGTTIITCAVSELLILIKEL